jgi:hypothetical protein
MEMHRPLPVVWPDLGSKRSKDAMVRHRLPARHADARHHARREVPAGSTSGSFEMSQMRGAKNARAVRAKDNRMSFWLNDV